MIRRADFFLKSYSCTEAISVSIEDLEIHIEQDPKNSILVEKLLREINVASETGILTLKGPNSKDAFREIAIEIRHLLCLALGKRIIFDRQKYWHDEHHELVTMPMPKNQNKGNQIIPDTELGLYIATTLPIWLKFHKTKKDHFFTMIDYLNQTKHDFIEDRVLRTVQAWECAANFWMPEVSLPEQLVELRSRIKTTIKNWKSENQYNDVDGEVASRILSAIDRQTLMIKLGNLLDIHKLKAGSLNLDLKYLKKLRDQVAHSGRIDIAGDAADKLLKPGITGLQLILLKEVGYKGKVNGEQNGWKAIRSIQQYFEED